MIFKIALVTLLCLPFLYVGWIFFWKLYEDLVRK